MPLRADGAVVDEFNLPRGYWEAKDSGDDLEKEIKAKFALGYPRRNILFQSPDRGVLYQNGVRILDESLAKPEQLSEVLRAFLTYTEPEIEAWDRASGDFKDRIVEHGRKLADLLEAERRKNAKFRAAFGDFVSLCRDSLNPALSEAAVEEMLVQHLLTWRIFKGIFDAGDFMQKNVIAREIEEVILTIGAFSREDFLKSINPFDVAVERAATKVPDFREKQKFLNNVYERFFQGFAVKQADTLGIVYTPQPIVDFMVASTERLLAHPKFQKRSLAHENVQILDGFTGTGNFIVNIVQFIAERTKSKLPHKYEKELHCNEVMLLPYYIASMNIEHAYLEAVGQYKAFEGICLVDTFNTAEEHTGGGVQTGLDFHWKATPKESRNSGRHPSSSASAIRLTTLGRSTRTTITGIGNIPNWMNGCARLTATTPPRRTATPFPILTSKPSGGLPIALSPMAKALSPSLRTMPFSTASLVTVCANISRRSSMKFGWWI